MSIAHKIDTQAIFAACILSAAGALVFNAFPLFLGNIAGEFGFNDEQLGLLGSAYLGGFALIALFAPLWMSRLPWRISGSAAYGLILLACIALKLAPAEKIHIAMVILGVGSGTIFTIALGVLSAARDPDRAYGWKLVAEMTTAGVLMWLMTSIVVDTFGYQGFIIGTVALYGISAFSIFTLPDNFLAQAGSHQGKQITESSFNIPAFLATVALFFQFGTFSGLWGFMERIGESNGVNSDAIGSILSLSLLTGLGGAFICVVIGQRFGHRRPILIALVLTLACILLLYLIPGNLAFAIAACAINALLQFLVATQMALVTVKDNSGRYTVMMAFILAAGGAIGPGVLGSVIETLGLVFGYIWATGFTLTAMALTLAATRGEREQGANGFNTSALDGI